VRFTDSKAKLTLVIAVGVGDARVAQLRGASRNLNADTVSRGRVPEGRNRGLADRVLENLHAMVAGDVNLVKYYENYDWKMEGFSALYPP
jgi:hypothetical protein